LGKRNILIVSLILLAFVSTASIGISTAGNVTNIDTQEDFTKIQDAINDNDTINGHTIAICNDTYKENIDVTKSLTIRPVDGDNVLIIGKSSRRPAVRVKANNVTITGINVSGPLEIPVVYSISIIFFTCGGIYIYEAHDCCINNCTIFKTDYGIELHKSDRNVISNNTIRTVFEEGIHIWSSFNNVVEYNNITDAKKTGINVRRGPLERPKDNNLIRENTSHNNIGFGVWIDRSDGNIVTNNCIKYTHQNYKSRSRYPGCGVHFDNAKDNVLLNNSICNNTDNGLKLYYSVKSIAQGNHISGNGRKGIVLSRETNANVTENNVSYNNEDGIHLWYSTGTITHNIITGNLGLCINNTGSDGATIEDNICTGNGITLETSN